MFKKMVSLILGLTLMVTSSVVVNAENKTKVKEVYIEKSTQIQSRGVKIPITYVIPNGKQNKKYPLVVMAHGHGGSKDENGGFKAIAESLGENGIASIRIDFPGCGESTESFAKNNLSNMLEDIKNAKDFMLTDNRINSDKVALFGYSMGGRLSMMTAGNDSSYKAVALLAPAAHDGNDLLSLLFNDKVSSYYDEAIKNGYCDYTTVFGQEQKLGAKFFDDIRNSNPIQDFSKFRGDVLVMYGEKDVTVKPYVSLSAAGSAVNSAKFVKTYMVNGADHGYGFYSDEVSIKNDVVKAATDFYKSVLLNKK